MVGMAELLTDDQISEALKHLTDWHHEAGKLTRTVEMANFPQAIQVVNRIAEIAEQENHHPDIDVRWRKLTFYCVTHSKGGITQADVSLAQEIDSVIDAFEQG
jgi:4a-hydroxytetrahydrobiopterin dehydratase